MNERHSFKVYTPNHETQVTPLVGECPFYCLKCKRPTDASDDMSVMVAIPSAGNDGDGSSCNLIILAMITKSEIIFQVMSLHGY